MARSKWSIACLEERLKPSKDLKHAIDLSGWEFFPVVGVTAKQFVDTVAKYECEAKFIQVRGSIVQYQIHGSWSKNCYIDFGIDLGILNVLKGKRPQQLTYIRSEFVNWIGQLERSKRVAEKCRKLS